MLWIKINKNKNLALDICCTNKGDIGEKFSTKINNLG